MTRTPAQLADISAAFKGLSEETKGKFKCKNLLIAEQAEWDCAQYDKRMPDPKRIERFHHGGTGCDLCVEGYLPTSDTAMAVLEEMGYDFLVSHTDIRYWKKDLSGRGTDLKGTSPLHCLLLALIKTGGGVMKVDTDRMRLEAAVKAKDQIIRGAFDAAKKTIRDLDFKLIAIEEVQALEDEGYIK